MRIHLPPNLETLKRLKFKTNQQVGWLRMCGVHNQKLEREGSTFSSSWGPPEGETAALRSAVALP